MCVINISAVFSGSFFNWSHFVFNLIDGPDGKNLSKVCQTFESVQNDAMSRLNTRERISKLVGWWISLWMNQRMTNMNEWMNDWPNGIDRKEKTKKMTKKKSNKFINHIVSDAIDMTKQRSAWHRTVLIGRWGRNSSFIRVTNCNWTKISMLPI